MLFRKQHSKQDSKSSTNSQSSSSQHSSSQGSYIRDSTTALPKNVNSMRTWEVQTQQEKERTRASARGSYAHAGTDWDQKNEDLERRAQGLPLRSRSMKKSWKSRLGKGPGLGLYT